MDAQDLLEEVDAALISPSDFTVALKVRRSGMFAMCKGYPLARATSAQVLAFVDNVMKTKIFNEKIEYWSKEFLNSIQNDDLNDEFSDANQITKLL